MNLVERGSYSEKLHSVLLPAITVLLYSWFQTGAVPAAANLSLIMPIHKRRDRDRAWQLTAHRGRRAPPALFAALLNARLVTYT